MYEKIQCVAVKFPVSFLMNAYFQHLLPRVFVCVVYRRDSR